MPLPEVGWGGRDTSGLSHEQIHRWTAAADPGALVAAREAHVARGAELRAAAERLDSAHVAAAERWQGRDADAAAERVQALRARTARLSETVTAQARGLDGLRAATERVQAAVGPPRPPALGSLAGPPALTGLPAALGGGAPDGFAAFRSAQAEEVAARAAYRAYLDETAALARSTPLGGADAPAPAGAAAGPGARGSVGAGSAARVPADAGTGSRGPGAGAARGSRGVLVRAAAGTDPTPLPARALAAGDAGTATPRRSGVVGVGGSVPGRPGPGAARGAGRVGAGGPVVGGAGTAAPARPPGPVGLAGVRVATPTGPDTARGADGPGAARAAARDATRPDAPPAHPRYLVPAHPTDPDDPAEVPRLVAPPVLGVPPVPPRDGRR